MLRIRFVSKHPREAIWGLPSVTAALLLSAGIHPIDMALRVLGAPRTVQASECRLANGVLSIQLAIQCVEGIGHIELGNYSNRLEYRCEALSESGASAVLEQHNRLWFTNLAGAAEVRHAADGKAVVGYEWPSRRGGYERTGYQPMLASFRDAVLDRTPSTSPLEACRDSYWVIDRAFEQLRESRARDALA
jgi:predicted dehydrogenase